MFSLVDKIAVCQTISDVLGASLVSAGCPIVAVDPLRLQVLSAHSIYANIALVCQFLFAY